MKSKVIALLVALGLTTAAVVPANAQWGYSTGTWGMMPGYAGYFNGPARGYGPAAGWGYRQPYGYGYGYGGYGYGYGAGMAGAAIGAIVGGAIGAAAAGPYYGGYGGYYGW